MIRSTLFSAGLVLAASCSSGSEQPPPEAAPPPAPAAMTLADVAGSWALVTVTEKGDTVRSTLAGTADPASWTLTLPGRDPIPVRVTVAGDSVVTEGGPYESVLRKGVMVTTRTVSRMHDGMLMGSIEAHYAGQADSVMHGTVSGTRNP